MLLIYDEDGFVEQAIFVGDFPALQAVYAEQGKQTMEVPHEAEPMRLYVRDGEAVPRPALDVTGELRTIKADGRDKLRLSIRPRAFDIVVRSGDVEVHRQTVDDGVVDFSVDHPGRYEITLEAAFPYWPTSFEIEAR